MQLVLWKIEHRFRAYENTIEVTLAIDSIDFKDHEDGEITVIIEAPNIKTMRLTEIEALAVSRASAILAK